MEKMRQKQTRIVDDFGEEVRMAFWVIAVWTLALLYTLCCLCSTGQNIAMFRHEYHGPLEESYPFSRGWNKPTHPTSEQEEKGDSW